MVRFPPPIESSLVGGPRAGQVIEAEPRPVAQQRLDALLYECRASYTLADGSKVKVMPHFRMTTSARPGEPFVKKMYDAVRKRWPTDQQQAQRLSTAITRCAFGLATPAQVSLVTQTLIDCGQLPAGGLGSDRVRLMMWEFGIGIDCAAFTAQAAARASGSTPEALGLKTLSHGMGLELARHWAFTNVPFTDARTGDVIQLDDRYGDVGHNVTVYDHHVLSASETARMQVTLKGPVHVFTVISSWGAQNNPMNAEGGVGSRVWLYSETTNTWANYVKGETRITSGPYDHVLTGTYRKR